MAIRASFIGVDKYVDPNIRELGGSRRDALALWALFTDSIPDIEARLLVDDQATSENIHQALNKTLDTAGPDDIVIVSFSGHGTHDHRLVTHDTVCGALSETTICMSDIARQFKTITRENCPMYS